MRFGVECVKLRRDVRFDVDVGRCMGDIFGILAVVVVGGGLTR